jgi:hypothetical protein
VEALQQIETSEGGVWEGGSGGCWTAAPGRGSEVAVVRRGSGGVTTAPGRETKRRRAALRERATGMNHPRGRGGPPLPRGKLVGRAGVPRREGFQMSE